MFIETTPGRAVQFHRRTGTKCEWLKKGGIRRPVAERPFGLLTPDEPLSLLQQQQGLVPPEAQAIVSVLRQQYAILGLQMCTPTLSKLALHNGRRPRIAVPAKFRLAALSHKSSSSADTAPCFSAYVIPPRCTAMNAVHATSARGKGRCTLMEVVAFLHETMTSQDDQYDQEGGGREAIVIDWANRGFAIQVKFRRT